MHPSSLQPAPSLCAVHQLCRRPFLCLLCALSGSLNRSRSNSLIPPPPVAACSACFRRAPPSTSILPHGLSKAPGCSLCVEPVHLCSLLFPHSVPRSKLLQDAALSGTSWFDLSPLATGLVVSGSLGGALLGSILAYLIADPLGESQCTLQACSVIAIKCQPTQDTFPQADSGNLPHQSAWLSGQVWQPGIQRSAEKRDCLWHVWG
jgi:hypothetical protein